MLPTGDITNGEKNGNDNVLQIKLTIEFRACEPYHHCIISLSLKFFALLYYFRTFNTHSK